MCSSAKLMTGLSRSITCSSEAGIRDADRVRLPGVFGGGLLYFSLLRRLENQTLTTSLSIRTALASQVISFSDGLGC